MYTIIMNNDKSLSTRETTTLYQGENLVDTLRFMLPITYESSNLADFRVVLKYIDMSNVVYSEELVLLDDLYKDCMLVYHLPIDSKITKFAGDIRLRLTLNNENQQKLHTSETTITIKPVDAHYQYTIDKTGSNGFDVVEF